MNKAEYDNVALMFRLIDYDNLYFSIAKEYESRKLGESLSDEEKLNEFSYISKQLRKYVTSKQTVILNENYSLEKMLQLVENIMIDVDEYSSERKEQVYIFLRNKWLLQLHGSIVNIMSESYEDDIEEE